MLTPSFFASGHDAMPLRHCLRHFDTLLRAICRCRRHVIDMFTPR